MRVLRQYISALGLLALMAGNPLVGYAEDITISIVDLGDPDYCGTGVIDREVLFILDAGIITLNDSLHYFEIELEFDPEVIRMDRALVTNTLAGQLEAHDFNVSNEEGLLYGSAGNLHANQLQAIGDKPLVAFTGRFIGDCTDSSVIKINYVFFGNEFKKTVGGYQDAVIRTGKKDKPQRKFEIELENPDLAFVNGGTAGVKVNIDTFDSNKVTRLDLVASSSENYQFRSIIVDDVRVKLLNEPVWVAGETLFELQLENFTGGLLGELVMNTTNPVDEEFDYEVRGFIRNECNCVTEDVNEARGHVSGKAGTSVDFNRYDDMIGSIEDHGNKIAVYLSDDRGKAIQYGLFDMLGNMKASGTAKESFFLIEKSGLATGVYFLTIDNGKDRAALKLNLN